MQSYEKKNDLLDFTSFFAWTFLNFLARCVPSDESFNQFRLTEPSLKLSQRIRKNIYKIASFNGSNCCVRSWNKNNELKLFDNKKNGTVWDEMDFRDRFVSVEFFLGWKGFLLHTKIERHVWKTKKKKN